MAQDGAQVVAKVGNRGKNRPMPYLTRELTRHGQVVWYVRVGSGPRHRVHGEYCTPEFRLRYEAALAASPAPKPATLVYFIRAGENVKIGFSASPGKRLATLQTSFPVKMTIYHVTPGGRELEAKLHKLFKPHRVSGEWFLWSKEIEAWVHADMAHRRRESKCPAF